MRELDGGRFTFETASLNFLDKSTITSTYWWTAGRYTDASKRANYHGLEWHPLSVRVPAGLQVESGIVGENFKRSILSAHQSFRGERNIRQVYRHPNKLMALASYFLLPYSTDSLGNLERLQKVVGRDLPVILSPPVGDLEETGMLYRPFGERLFQPTTEVMKRWNVGSIDGLIEEYQLRGYDGFCFDTVHSRVLRAVDLGKDTDGLRRVLEHTREVHLSAGRTDMNWYYRNPDPLSDLRELVGSEGGEFSNFVRDIANNWSGGAVVTEIPASSIFQLARERSDFGGGVNKIPLLLDYHRRVTNSLNKLFR